jgi:tetratricopeptide (TPR) repeat protein
LANRASADVVGVRTRDGAARVRVTGTIDDYTGRELTITLETGTQRRIPAEQVLDIETHWSAERRRADELYAAHDYKAAAVAYDDARKAEKRRWARRIIIARLVEAFQANEQLVPAGEAFLLLVRDDPETPDFASIPLPWLPGEPAPDLARRAEQWMANAEQPAAMLLGASYLLPMAEQGHDAVARLEQLTAQRDPRIATLAEAQLWRGRFASATASQLEGWSRKLDRFPESLRAGPYLTLGRAWLQLGQQEQAELALLHVPILFPRQRRLAAEALWLAAGALSQQGHPPEAARLYHELIHDYPDSRHAAEARNRLALLGGGAAADSSAPAPPSKP